MVSGANSNRISYGRVCNTQIADTNRNSRISEQKNEFTSILDSARQQYYDTYISSNLKESESGNPLTHEEILSLAKRYNPESMTEEEYSSFLNDLTQLGIIQEEDKNFIGGGYYSKDGGRLVCLGTAEEIKLHGGATYVGPLGTKQINSLEDAKGNVMQWAKYTSSLLGFNTTIDSGTNMFPLRSASIFQKLLPILEDMRSENLHT